MNVLLFDIGNVLVDFEFERLYAIHAQYSGRPVAPFSMQELQMRDALERGEILDSEWVDYLNEHRGLGWNVGDLVKAWQSMFTKNKTGYGLFRKAIESDAQVYVLSNIAKHHIDAIENNWNGFFDGITGLFLSYQIGVRKPHIDIYRHALDNLGVDGDQCLFIDDLPENIEAARSVGIHAHRFIPENHAAIESVVSEFIEG